MQDRSEIIQVVKAPEGAAQLVSELIAIAEAACTAHQQYDLQRGYCTDEVALQQNALRAQAALEKIAARFPEMLPAKFAHNQARPSEVSSGVAEMTLGVEGLPLVQTGPGGDFTQKLYGHRPSVTIVEDLGDVVKVELPRVDSRGMQSWFRKLGDAIGGKLDVRA